MIPEIPDLQSRSLIPTSRFLRMSINPNIGSINYTTAHEEGNCLGNVYQSARNKELAHGRERYCQEQLAKHKIRSEDLAFSSEYSTALDIKKCVLQVQKLCLRDLAAEENHVNNLARIAGEPMIDLDKSHKEVERVINALRHREQKSNNHSDGF